MSLAHNDANEDDFSMGTRVGQYSNRAFLTAFQLCGSVENTRYTHGLRSHHLGPITSKRTPTRAANASTARITPGQFVM